MTSDFEQIAGGTSVVVPSSDEAAESPLSRAPSPSASVVAPSESSMAGTGAFSGGEGSGAGAIRVKGKIEKKKPSHRSSIMISCAIFFPVKHRMNHLGRGSVFAFQGPPGLEMDQADILLIPLRVLLLYRASDGFSSSQQHTHTHTRTSSSFDVSRPLLSHWRFGAWCTVSLLAAGRLRARVSLHHAWLSKSQPHIQ